MQRHATLLANLLVLGSSLPIQPGQAQTIFPQAVESTQAQYRQQQVQQVRPDRYDLTQYPITDEHEDYWKNLLWTTAIVEPQEDYVEEAIAQILSLAPRSNLSSAQRRVVEAALQVGTQLYLSQPADQAALGTQFLAILERSPDPEWAAMALSALVKAGAEAEQRQSWVATLQQRFPQWSNNVHLFTTLREVAGLDNPPDLPPLEDLLSWSIAPGELQMYVLCTEDRAEVCQTVLKDGQGEFVRQADGQLWSVTLLTRSLHGLSWNFTRGETPQGVYRIEGVRPANLETFRAYGQFSLVKLFVPFEDGVQSFIPGQPGTLSGGLAAYQQLLPPSWRAYLPIQQTYWAGQAGRGLFRIHGSGEDPTFFTNNRYYPDTALWNPTIGCLSARELYDESGRLLQADMPVILNALTAVDGQDFTGYLIVVEVPTGADLPISLESIEEAIATR